MDVTHNLITALNSEIKIYLYTKTEDNFISSDMNANT